jgi:hypothetical protein
MDRVFDEYLSAFTMMPPVASVGAALSVTVVHVGPKVAPLPQYWKEPDVVVAVAGVKVNVPFVFNATAPPTGVRANATP